MEGRGRILHVREQQRLLVQDLRRWSQGPNSIEKFQLEFWLEKSLELWLEIPYTKKICVRFKMESRAELLAETQAKNFSIELGPWPAPSGWRLLKPGMKKPRPGLAEWGELELVLRVRRRFCRFILMGEVAAVPAPAEGDAVALKWGRFDFGQ